MNRQITIIYAQNAPEKRYKPQLVVQTGHSSTVSSIAFSPNGRILASGSDDKTIKLWDTATRRQIRSLEGHNDNVNSVAFSSDGKTLASGGGDVIKLWNLESGQEIRSLVVENSEFTSVAFSPNGQTLAAGSLDKSVRLWNVETGQQVKSLEGHTDWVNSIAISPDGKTLVSGSRDKTVRLWDLATGTQIKSLEGHTDLVNSVAFSADGKTVASGSDDRLIKLWNTESLKEIRTFTRQSDAVESLAFSPDGNTLASGTAYGETKIWDVESGVELHSFDDLLSQVNTLAFSPDGKTLASGGFRTINLRSIKSGERIQTLIGHTGWVNFVAYSPDGKTFASGGSDHSIKLWSVETGRQVTSLDGHTSWVNSVAFSPDGKILASGSSDHLIKLWSLETGKEIRSFEGHTDQVNSLAFSNDGKTLASGSNDYSVKLWNVTTGIEIKSFVGHTNEVESVAFSPDGQILVSSSFRSIRFWNVASGQQMRAFEGHPTVIRSVTFSPDGKVLASGGFKNIKLWSVETGEQLKSFPAHASTVRSLTFSPDGKTLVSVGHDRIISLWNVETGLQIKSLKDHTDWIRSVAFSPNGQFILSGSVDGTIKLWNTQSDRPLATLVTMDKTDWVVTTPDGRFDSSEGASALLHYVISDPKLGYEVVALDQLKSKSYTPGLLKDILVGKDRPNNLEYSVSLYPTVEIQSTNSPKLDLKLENRGGGIGRIEIKVNGTESISDARIGRSVDAKAANVSLQVEIPKERLRNGNNKIEVVAWNLEGDVRSRSDEFSLNVSKDGLNSKGTEIVNLEPEKKPSEINYYAIISGVSDYAGDQLDLRYAAKDAEDISRSISIAARKYFCNEELANKKPCERVHLRLLSTEKDKQSQFAGLSDVPDFKRFEPTKKNFKDVFAEVAQKAKPEDVVFVYLSGHGTAIISDEAVKESAFPDMYLYPTQDAASIDRVSMSNQTEREAKTVSSLELARWVFDIKAGKKVMIFDTCSAGAAQKDLISQSKAVDGLQIRSLDRLRERTGFYILMGSAADAVSYEANQYRQGLLTYSLIEAMTVDTVLEDGRFLDVEKWFNYAENKVEDLAKGIGGIQKPSFFKGQSKPFSVGRIETEERKNIQPARKVPLILQPELREAGKFTDKERLTEKLETGLLEQSIVSNRGEGNALNYIKATNASNGLSPRGFYSINPDGTTTVEVSLIRDEEEIAKVRVVGKKEEIVEKLIKEIVRAVQNEK